MFADVGLAEKRQGAASCVITTCASLTVTVARRTDGSTFALTRNATSPLPCPLVSAVSVSHGDALVALQVQSRVVVTVNAPEPPVAATLCGAPPTDTSHLVEDGPLTDRSVELQAKAAAASAIAADVRARTKRSD
jgi:hypothetical protein